MTQITYEQRVRLCSVRFYLQRPDLSYSLLILAPLLGHAGDYGSFVLPAFQSGCTNFFSAAMDENSLSLPTYPKYLKFLKTMHFLSFIVSYHYLYNSDDLNHCSKDALLVTLTLVKNYDNLWFCSSVSLI